MPAKSFANLAWLAACLTVAVMDGRARAAEPALPSVPDAKSAGDSEARRLFEGGVTAFDAGDYDVAIVRFRAAYARTRAPALLFNIAQALRRKGDCAGGLQAYESFKSLSPEQAKGLDVDSMIREMRAVCPVDTRTDADTSAAPRLPLPAASDPAAKVPLRPLNTGAVTVLPAPSSVRRSAAWTALGLGAGLAALGGYSAYNAHRIDQRLSELTGAGTAWNGYGAELERQGNQQRTLSVVGLAAGGAALVTGVVLLIWDWRRGGAQGPR